MVARSFRLSTRLGLSHGILVALLVIVVAVTLQGLVRMLELVVEIRDQGLSSLDAENELHRAAWKIEVAMRHGRAACTRDATDAMVLPRIADARRELEASLARRAKEAPERLRAATQRYATLARSAPETNTCAFLLSTTTDDLRAALDEELTNAWIDRLRELHADIQTKEDEARRTGTFTTACGMAIAALAAVIAVAVGRSTNRRVSEPIMALAASATRLGEGEFDPIPFVSGPRELEELSRNLERARVRLQEVDELKQAFLASISHEMRSPLTSVREGLSLLADGTCGPLAPKQQRVVELATRACEREVRIVEALLDLSRFRSGVPLKREAACDIDRVLEAALESERDDAARHDVRIELVNEEAVPLTQLDSALVERAVSNLVRNAVSVSKPGQSVRIVRKVVDGIGKRDVSIDVIDQGPGLPEELREALFRPFVAATVAGVERPAGIGLGLSFAREVARAHGGDLTVVRSDASGTTFRFAVPVQEKS
jgi:two-component system sensor histidine kinase GlrK